MNFAKKQLEKFGWKEGEGLGRNKTGISKPLKPKLKFDTGGLGHNIFDEINNTWWQRLYDEAAKNLVVKEDKSNSVILETKDKSVEISTKKKSKKRKANDEIYKHFIKTSELNFNVEKKITEDEADVSEGNLKMTSGVCDLTDEELFRACGGRTVHKGARHGVHMNAKLSRIEKQESFLKNMDSNVEFKEKKKKKKLKFKVSL